MIWPTFAGRPFGFIGHSGSHYLFGGNYFDFFGYCRLHGSKATLTAFAPHGPLIFGLDDTIERRWDAKIATRGIYRDPVRSSRSHFVKVSGLRWLCMMLAVPIPWAARVWALPFLTALCPSERYHDSQGKRHKTLTDWARQLVKQVKRWLPGRQLIIVADSTFAALDFSPRPALMPPPSPACAWMPPCMHQRPARRLGQRGLRLIQPHFLSVDSPAHLWSERINVYVLASRQIHRRTTKVDKSRIHIDDSGRIL
jgi:hypothetical protein